MRARAISYASRMRLALRVACELVMRVAMHATQRNATNATTTRTRSVCYVVDAGEKRQGFIAVVVVPIRAVCGHIPPRKAVMG